MKNRISLLWVFLFIIALMSCDNVKYVKFNFNPEIPYKSNRNMIKAKIFVNKEVRENMQVGLIAGLDEKNTKFIVISKIPQTSPIEGTEIEDFIFSYSSLIEYDKLQELIDIVNASIECWDSKQEKGEIIFYKYYIFPEQNEVMISPNVVSIEGSFIFEFQNSKKGSIVLFYFGEKIPYVQKIKDKEVIEKFYSLLLEAKDYLDSSHKPETNEERKT